MSRAHQLNTTETTLPVIYALTKKANQMGVPIIAGTDQMYSPLEPYPNLHEELRLLVEECDLSPLEAIQAATIRPAQYFRLDNVGKVKEGYRADLILLEKNPCENINFSKTIIKVIKNGKIID